MARKLFQLCLKNHVFDSHHHNQCAVILDKQNAQAFLIESCLYQQNLLRQFCVTQDLTEKQLKPHAGMGEMLLFIRMNHLHLSQDTLNTYIDLNMGCYNDNELNLEVLLNNKLIQKIHCFGQNFYDKNPFPHDHLYDRSTQTLTDYDKNLKVSVNQKVIRYEPNFSKHD